jgi:tetratricopeptide (TPR) repeat protein
MTPAVSPVRRLSLAAGLVASLVTTLATAAPANPRPPAKAPAATTMKKVTVGPKADVRSQAKAEVEKGQLDYKLGRFERALDEYTRAYELVPAPALLFNLGQCHRNLSNYERAIFFFEGYLREQTKISQDQRALTEDLLAECKTELQRQRDAAAAAAARFAAPPLRTAAQLNAAAGAVTPTAPRTSWPMVSVDRNRPTTGDSKRHGWLFWTAVAGATVIAAGAVAYYATGDARFVEPTGSLGTLDRR